MKKREVYTIEDIAFVVEQKLPEGLGVSESVIKMVLLEYFETKRDILSDGDIIDEGGIGQTEVRFRRVPQNFSKDRFTVKLDCAINTNLKDNLIDRVKVSSELREKLGIEELPEVMDDEKEE